MANSKIRITFHGKVEPPFKFDIMDQDVDTGLFTRRHETWVYGLRAGANQVSQSQLPDGSPDLSYANEAASNYRNAFRSDYGSRYNVTDPTSNIVEITSLDPNFIITSVDTDIPTPSIVEWEIIDSDVTPITIDSFELQENATQPCEFYQIEVTTDTQATEYEWFGATYPVTTNPFIVPNVNKDLYMHLIVRNATGGEDFITSYVEKLASDNITVNVTAVPDGGTVNVNVDNAYGLVLEYSLDGTVWTDSNTFTAQPEGDYTMHVRDQFGCEVTKDYSVTALGTRDPYHFFSDANSFNWVLREVIDHCKGIYRNDTNSFGYESLALLPTCEDTLISKCDPKITTQLKTNFANVSVLLRDEFGGEVDITPIKMTANINRFQSMDCNYYDYGDNKTGIYFTSGDTYDENGVVNGTYALNGNLPDFAVIGNYIEINGSTYQIQSILYDDNSSIQKRVIVIDEYYSGSIAPAIIKSSYDVLPYEVYQFDVDFSTKNIGIYDIVVTLEDDYMDTVIYQTENINLATTHFGTVALNYYNTNNRDIFYKWGIENFIRVPYISIQAASKEESSNNLSDTGANVVDSLIYRADKIDFGEREKSIMQKIEIATGCEFVFVNGVGYALDSSFELEPIGQTNTYQCSRTMVQTGVSYNTRQTDNSGVDADYTDFNIPPFITDGSGFIKQ